jgi:hypothetical protein
VLLVGVGAATDQTGETLDLSGAVKVPVREILVDDA